MANRTLRVLLKKIYTDGSIDTIYLKSRASDVFLDGSSTDTLASIVTKVNGIQEGATAVAASSTNGYISINGTATQVYAHPNSGVTAGTYNSVTVNAAGHVTAGTSNSYLLASSKVTFTEASTKANIVSNSDTIATMLGKLAKWYSSFGSLAWLSSVGTSQLDNTLSTAYNQRVVTGTANTTASVTESREITAAGYVADARAVANLQNQINTINSSLITLESNLTWETKRFFHFTSVDAPSGYRAVQVIFDVNAASPILISDYDKNFFVVDELWDDITTTIKSANVYWINNTYTIDKVQCARYWNNTQYRIKISYKTTISSGSFLSLDGRAHFDYQEFVIE